jgi:hypothetical protein
VPAAAHLKASATATTATVRGTKRTMAALMAIRVMARLCQQTLDDLNESHG